MLGPCSRTNLNPLERVAPEALSEWLDIDSVIFGQR